MIVEEIFYGIKCNRCLELHEDGEHSFWNDHGNAIESAMESDWINEKGKDYCPNCHEINDETDELIIFEDFPKHIVVLNKFIDKIVIGFDRRNSETNSLFVVNFSLYNKENLEDAEENFIKILLGDNLNRIEYYSEKHNRNKCFIKIHK